jgi:hypothetical protein
MEQLFRTVGFNLYLDRVTVLASPGSVRRWRPVTSSGEKTSPLQGPSKTIHIHLRHRIGNTQAHAVKPSPRDPARQTHLAFPSGFYCSPVPRVPVISQSHWPSRSLSISSRWKCLCSCQICHLPRRPRVENRKRRASPELKRAWEDPCVSAWTGRRRPERAGTRRLWL